MRQRTYLTKSEEVGLKMCGYILGAIIGTVVVEGVYMAFLDHQMQSLSQNHCIQEQQNGGTGQAR